MPSLRLVAGAILAALLLAPIGAAASGWGDLALTRSALLPGASSFDATSAQFLWKGDGAPLVQFSGSDVTVEIYGTNKTTQAVPVVGNVAFKNYDVASSTQHGASKLTLQADLSDATFALSDAGSVAAQWIGGRLQADEGALLANAIPLNTLCTAPRCLSALGEYEIAAASTNASLSGDVTLLLHGPALLVTNASGETKYLTGSHTQTTGTLTTTTELWAVVTLHRAVGTIQSDRAASWFAASPAIQTSALKAEAAAGSLTVGARRYAASHEPLEIEGALTLTGAPVAAGTFDSKGGSHAAPSFTLHVSGDVQRVNLRATSVFDATPAQTAGIAAAIALGAALVAYAWPHLAYGAAALYTRLRRPHILDNEVRNSIYEIIRTNPGISARSVHRHSAQSWGTVVYHLRQLERHQLVVSRSLGRTRNYYENHGKYRGMEVQLACLQSPRARALARLVLAQPGVTQEDLVGKSAFPQPTTSYYLRKLKASGLVEERREGRYARYHPLGDLARFLELADNTATPTVGIPDGVQA